MLGMVILLCGAGLGDPPEPRLTAPPLHWNSPEERSETLYALRDAWDTRPLTLSKENNRAERAFLNRLIVFLRRNRRREIYVPACGFWNTCYRDHVQYYGDITAGK